MADKTINIKLALNSTEVQRGANKAITSLEAIEKQANQTREKMEKLAQVGNKVAFMGAAIVAPFMLAMKKYVDTAKETEPVSKRLLALNQKWEESQVRLGRVVAKEVLPTLEKAVGYLDKVIDYAEKNPDVVKAALTIGTTLVVLGGITTTVAQTVSMLATIKGLLAGAAIAANGGNAAVLAGGGISGALAALGPVIVGSIAAWAGANLGLIITNALTGQSYTMTDLANTAKLIVMALAKGLDQLLGYFGLQPDLFNSVSDAMKVTAEQRSRFEAELSKNQTASINTTNVQNASAQMRATADSGSAIVNALGWLGSIFNPSKPEPSYGTITPKHKGGYVSDGIYRLGEKEYGDEFVLTNKTTRRLERLLGKKITQDNILEVQKYILKTPSMTAGLENIRSQLKKLTPQFSKKQLAAMQYASKSNQPNNSYLTPGQYEDFYQSKYSDLVIKPGQYNDMYTPRYPSYDTYLRPGQYNDMYIPKPQKYSQSAVTNNLQVGHGMTIAQTKRLMRDNNREMMNALLSL